MGAFLFEPCPAKAIGSFNDNLAFGIYVCNRETDYVKTVNEGINVLRLYLEEHNLIPLSQYIKCLEDYK